MKNKLPNINSNTGRFIDGNPNTGTLGTIVTAEWLNGVQERVQDVFEELRNVLLLGNMQPDGVRQNQVAEAIKAYCNNINLKVQSNTRNFDNYIPNSKKSTAVNSNSADTVATSFAVKTAYDKALEAKNIADAAYKVEKTNQNQNLNNLLGQNTVFGIAGRAAGTTGLGDIYNYGVGIAINAAGANATLYIPHSHTNSNNGVWVQSSFTGSATNPFWRRIDGSDWGEIRNRPISVVNNLRDLDLNNVTEFGLYGQPVNVHATSARNYPVQQAGTLIVTPSAYGYQQEYTTFYTCEKYVRGKDGDRWNEWKRIDGANKVNKSGDTMTGQLNINTDVPLIKLKRNNEDIGFIGAANGTTNNIKIHTYKNDTFLELQDSKAYINKLLEIAGNIVVKSGGDWSGIELWNRANKKLIIESKQDNTSSIGSIIYRNGSSNEAAINIPRKSGTMALIEDITSTVKSAVSRSPKSRTINGNSSDDQGTTRVMNLVGDVVVYPDGKIEQTFHLKQFRDFWFAREEGGIGIHNNNDWGRIIPITLWTAMPNRVAHVHAQIMRSSDTALSAMYSSEAREQVASWAIRKQGSNKGQVWVDIARISGNNSEHIDLFVKVEGY